MTGTVPWQSVFLKISRKHCSPKYLERSLGRGISPDLCEHPWGVASPLNLPRSPQCCNISQQPPQPLGIGTCLQAAFQALHRHRGCAQVDFSQPFSLRVRQLGIPLDPLQHWETIPGMLMGFEVSGGIE